MNRQSPIPHWVAPARALVSSLRAKDVSFRDYYNLVFYHANEVEEATRHAFSRDAEAHGDEETLAAHIEQYVQTRDLAGLMACAVRVKWICFEYLEDSDI